jgi:hypothetical protein
MKTKLFFVALFGCSVLIACAPKTIPNPTETATPSLTFTPVLQTSTPTVEWIIYATPLNLSYDTSNDEIILVIDELFSGNCIKDKQNLLKANPTLIAQYEPMLSVPPLIFSEISALPEPSPNYWNERADNIDNSLTALIICQTGDCSKVYIKNNELGNFYKVDFGASTMRPLGHLHWINKNTFVVVQEFHAITQIFAVNVAQQQFEYYGHTGGCPRTPMPSQTPTP